MTLDLKKALAGRVVLLKGDESLLVRRALADVLAAAEVTAEDFDYAAFVADAIPPAEWFGAAMTVPFLAPRRVVVVRNVARVDAKVYDGVSFTLPESALLILVADDEAASDERARKLASNVTALDRLVKGAGGYVAEFKSDPKAAKAAVVAEATRLGRRLSARAAETLLEMCGGSLGRAIEELEKVVLFTESDPIPEGAVEAVVVPSREWSIWKLVDAVATGRPDAALTQLRTLLSTGKKADAAALETVLPQLARQMRLLWQGRLVIDLGINAASAGFPEKPSFANEADYRQRAILERVRGLDAERIARCFGLLADADAAIKGLADHYSATETLERTVLLMCSAVRPGRNR